MPDFTRNSPAPPPPPPPRARPNAVQILDAQAVEPLDAQAVFEPPPVPRTGEVVFDAILLPEPWYHASPPIVVWRLICLIVGETLSALEWVFGAMVLMVGLAVLAALPILQFLSLGYLLEAGARVARTGRMREGFIGVRLAARLGGIIAASYLLLLPVRFVSDLAKTAYIIDPGSQAARSWRIGLLVLIAFTALHIAAACARGGKLRYFLWPFNLIWLARRLFLGGYYCEARDAVWNTVMALRLPYYFWLGLRGFIAAFAWLALPVSLMVLGHLPNPVAPLIGWFGGLLLALVLLYLPFLQMRMAEQNRLAAAFELLAVRADFRRAPWIFTIALIVTLLSALPLYLLKIEVVPAEAAWLPSLVFVAFIFPARLITGWAVGCARHRPNPSHWFFRWTGRIPQIPVVLFYVIIIFFTQFTSWNGIWSLYEQHAFLLPVPFFGM